MESLAPTLDALYGWINSLQVTDTVKSVDDFSDGIVIEKVLHQIDPRHFSNPSSSVAVDTDFEHSYARLEQSCKALTTFLVKNCRRNPDRLPPPPDLRLVASGESPGDLFSLLGLVILAAFTGGNRDIYAKEIQALPIASQKSVYELIASHAGDDHSDDDVEEDVGDDDEDQRDGNAGSEESSQPGSSPGDNKLGLPVGFDTDLVREQRLLKLVAERNQALQEQQASRYELEDLIDRYGALQQGYDKSQDELRDTKDRLETLLSGKDRPATNRGSQSETEEKIAELETKLTELAETNKVLNQAKESFRVKAEKMQSLQDGYDEIKQQNASLRNRVNALDKYRQKAEEGRNLEDRNLVLEAKVVDLQKQLKESDSSQFSIAELRRTNDEYRQLLSNIEQDRNEQHEMKMRVELQYHTLVAEHKESLDELARQNAANEELESRLHDYEGGHTPTTPKLRVPESMTLSSCDGEFAHDEAKLSQEFAMVDVDDQNYISEAELRAIIAAMQAQARGAGESGKPFSIAEEKKLAGKIERTRHTAKQLIQVIDFLAQPRIELVAAKDLDQSRPFQSLRPRTGDEAASIYASANASVTSLDRSSGASLPVSSLPPRRPPVPSVRDTSRSRNDSTTHRRGLRSGISSFWLLGRHTQKQSDMIAQLQMQLSLAAVTQPQEQADPLPVTSPPAAPPLQTGGPSIQHQLEDALRSNQQLKQETQLMASAWYDQNQRRLYDAPAPMMRHVPQLRSFLGKQRRMVEGVMMGKPWS